VFANAYDRHGGRAQLWEIKRDDEGRVTELVADQAPFEGRAHNLLEEDE
jgi:hypothetical protein